eukprot:scaffold132773_cov21-Prasinocladus_malaysianus.AAC.1
MVTGAGSRPGVGSRESGHHTTYYEYPYLIRKVRVEYGVRKFGKTLPGTRTSTVASTARAGPPEYSYSYEYTKVSHTESSAATGCADWMKT